MNAHKAIKIMEGAHRYAVAGFTVAACNLEVYEEAVAALREMVPKRYEVGRTPTGYTVRDTNDPDGDGFSFVAHGIPTREAAERIAAIYEES